MNTIFTIDTNSHGMPFPHYWELCVGSCHAYTALRADYQQLLIKAHNELGYQYVRFHGLLNDGMSVCVRNMFSGQVTYSFHNIDQIFDFLLSIGMKPFIELGFMPTAIASGSATCFLYRGNITPPRDYADWHALIKALTEHLVARYGIEEVRKWFFEVWNEPNLVFFWHGTKEQYMQLYTAAARAVKEVDSQLRVGGPATSVNAWIPDLIGYCREHDVPLDFISTHHYPSDDPLGGLSAGYEDLGQPGDNPFEKLSQEELMAFFAKLSNPNIERGVLTGMVVKAKAEAGDLPLYYTEWNSSVVPQAQDDPYAAAFIVKTLADNAGLVEGYSFWTFADIFEESQQNSNPFHNGFGLLTIHGVPKPSYHAYALMHQLGSQRLPVEVDGAGTVEMLATRKSSGLALLLYNHNVPGKAIQAEPVTIRLRGVLAGRKAVLRVIDDQHANPKARWVEQGCPGYPSPAQVEELMQASVVSSEPVQVKPDGDCWLIELTAQPHSVIGIEIW